MQTKKIGKQLKRSYGILIFIIAMLIFAVPVQAKNLGSYKDKTCSISVAKGYYSKGSKSGKGGVIYAAHVKLKNYNRFHNYCANGKYNHGSETVTLAAKRLNAILCVNGDYSAPYLKYTTVRAGKVVHDGLVYTPAVYSSKTGIFSAPETIKAAGKKASWLVKKKYITDTFCFGPAILVNGKIQAKNDEDRAQRTFIGTNGKPGDFWICVSEGRGNEHSAGLNYYQCARFLKDKGCKFGIPLDGGGSSTMVFKGKTLNTTRGRAVVDFLAVR